MIRVVWKLLGTYLPHRTRRFLALGTLSAVAGVLEAVVLVLAVRAAVAVADGVDHVSMLGRGPVSVGTLLWIAAAASLLSVSVGIVVARMTAATAGDVLRSTRADLLHAFSRASWNHQSSALEGSVQEAVANNAMQSSDVCMFFAKGLSSLLSLTALLAAALFVSAWATGAVIGVGLAIVLLLRPITRSTRRQATGLVDANARYSEAVAEASALTLEMRVFGVERAEADRLGEEAADTGRKAARTRFSSEAGMAIYRNATLLFLVGAVAGLYAIGTADLSAVGAVVVLIVRALSYAQQAQSQSQRVNELGPNLVALDAKIREFDAVRERFGSAEVDSVGHIALVGVSYHYGDLPALRDLDLEIGRGELLGVVGPSGGGKSTLVQVLLRLRPPTTGAVLVDGRPYEEIRPSAWSRLVSMVPQEPRLFAGTVAENIAFHRPGLTRDQIVEAARRAHILEEIEQLPGAFDAPLGARGSGLSGGQRQRLAIARALVGEPDLLVLDEPTSALDVHSERLLQRTIEELAGRVTMVIVAHRLTTIAACERLLVLEHGEIAALGPYAEVQRHPFLRRAHTEPPPGAGAQGSTVRPAG